MSPPSLAPHRVEPDFKSGDFHRDPYPQYERYRSATPVFRDGTGDVYLTRYRDCELLLTDSRFRRQPQGGNGMNPFQRERAAPNALDVMVGHWMIFMDPPRHDVVRRAFGAPFTARSLKRLDPAIRTVVRHLLDEWRGRATVELVSAFASPLPIFVMCELLGIASSDWPLFSDWSLQMMRAVDSGTKEDMHAAIPASVAIRDYFSNLLASRAAYPGDDFLGDLIAAGEAGTLTADELICGIAFLIIAGHETTKNLIGSGVLTLTEHTDQLELLRREPELIDSAVEELLRFHSPLQKISRWTGAPMPFGEYAVAEGVLVTALIGAANRDPSVFRNPAQFDIRRSPNRHLAFGRGMHVCLGTTLARLEGRIALDALLRALPRIEVVDHRWRGISSFRALERLTLALD